MDYAHIDKSRFPLVTIAFADFEPSPKQFQSYLNQLDELHIDTDRFFLLIDASRARFLNAEMRTKHAEWIRKRQNLIRNNIWGMAFVLPNLALRLMLRALLAMQDITVPYKIFSTPEEALAYFEASLHSSQGQLQTV
ncbi:MAG: hypothetical protein HC842_06410 [Cytophagales bacterium]|nr:hypothetical protein [Cytophagales bacterium]